MTTSTKKAILFVYGTLKKDDCRNYLLKGARFIGNARTSVDFTLFSCGAFPAMVEATKGPGELSVYQTGVLGELYEIDSSLLDNCLDGVEGRPYLYDRAVVPIETVETEDPEDVKITEAVTYIFQRPVLRLEHLGNYWRPRR